MKLIDMQRSKKEIKKQNTGLAEPNTPDYPWGLEISLETESIEKLGINLDTMRVGKEYSIMAVCEVTSISESASKDNSSKNMRLQIKKMAFEKGKSDSYHALMNAKPEEDIV